MQAFCGAQLALCLSLGLTLVFIINFPSVVLGSKLYLYEDDVKGAVIEVKSNEGYFQTSTKPKIVEFYSPYCGHCHSFRPLYLAVANEAREIYGSSVEFYAVSCAAHNTLCRMFQVSSYPTVVAIPEGASVKEKVEVNRARFTLNAVEESLKLDRNSQSLRQLNDGADVDVNRNEMPSESRNDFHLTENQDTGIQSQEPRMQQTQSRKVGSDRQSKRAGYLQNHKGVLSNGILKKEKDTSEPESLNTVRDGDDKEEEDIEEGNQSMKPVSEEPKVKTSAADKWKEIQKKRLREKEYLMLRNGQARATGNLGEELHEAFNGRATRMQKAHRRDTSEYSERKRKQIETIERMRKGRKYREMLRKGGIPFKKQVSKPRLIERLPVVRGIARMNPEEQLILDASLSFLTGLRLGVFKTNDPLSSDKKAALKSWLELLLVSLPREWALQDTISDLLKNFNSVTGNPKALTLILAKQPFPRKGWSPSCSISENEFSCGFWKLLHVMTLGVAELRGGIDLVANGEINSEVRTFSPAEAADTVRDYMRYFFLCTECSNHFIDHYDDCENNRRCERLSLDKVSATDSDWRELALWMWETHNEINVRLLNEKEHVKRIAKESSRVFRKAEAGPGSASLENEIRVEWPTIGECLMCFSNDGFFHEDNVFLYLERTYWPGYDLKDTPLRLLWFEDTQTGSGLGLLAAFGLVIFLMVARLVSTSSVQSTMLRAKKLGASVVHGGKIRTKD